MRVRIGVAAALALAAIAMGAPALGSPVDWPEHEITEDTTWTKAESPYRFDVPVVVEYGVTLTIEPGVRVEVQRFEVAGALVARGTEAEPIVFTDFQDDFWEGIYFLPDATPASAVEHVHIENAYRGLYMSRAAFPVHDTVFTRNVVALFVENPDANLTFTGNEFYSNETAFRGRTSGLIGIYENDFWDNETSLFFQAQSPWECQTSSGIYDIRYNDILRGPDARWFAFDVRASRESGASDMVIRATDNWWGTTDEHDITARVEPDSDCCPTSGRIEVEWRDPAAVPQTPAEPPGPVGTPENPGITHGDPAYIVRARSPLDRRCYGSVDEIKGRVLPGIRGVPRRIGVSLSRSVPETCRWYDPDTGRFSTRQACDRHAVFEVRVVDGRFRVKLDRPLRPGRYTFGAAFEKVRFRVLPR